MAEFVPGPQPVTADGRQPCRCLLADFWPDMHASVADYVALLGEDEKTPENEYRRRLDICLTCDKLRDGTCGLCGCYVEARAAKQRMKCPDIPDRWK